MSITIIQDSFLKSRISQTSKVVYFALMSHYRGQGSAIFPSYNRLATLAGISRRQAIRCIQELVKAGYLTKNHNMRVDGGYASNLYYPSDINDTTPSDINDTTNNSNFKNNNIFKKYNTTRARTRKNAAGDMPETSGTPEQTDIEDYTQNNRDTSILQALQSLGKGMEWLQLLRANGKYYLRPASAKAFNYVTDEQFEYFRKNAEMLAGSCHGLKWGQWLPNEILIKEIK